MRWVVTLAACLAGCSFDRHGLAPAESVDADVADAMPDASVDAMPDATPDADPCPAGYTTLPGGNTGSRYRIGSTSKVWLDAELDCEHDGLAHLVVLDGDGERDAVRGVTKSQVWVGVSDRVSEGTFFKVTGAAATYLPWLGGEPNNQFNEDCVELKGGGFNDQSCDTSQGYACECDGLAAKPLAYTPP